MGLVPSNGLVAQAFDFESPEQAAVVSQTQGTLTNNSGGTDGGAIAATVGIKQIVFPVPLTALADADIVTDYVPGFKFKLIALDFVTSVPSTTASKTSTVHLEIGSTAVGAGTCVVTTASTSAKGELTAGAAITSANTGSSTAAISIVGASTTAFLEGEGSFIVTLQDMDIADGFTAAAADIAQVKVDVAAILTALKNANLMATS